MDECKRVAEWARVTRSEDFRTAFKMAQVVRRYYPATFDGFAVVHFAEEASMRLFDDPDQHEAFCDLFEAKWQLECLDAAADPLGTVWRQTETMRFTFDRPVRGELQTRIATAAFLLSQIRQERPFQLPQAQLGRLAGVDHTRIGTVIRALCGRKVIELVDASKRFGCADPKAYGYRFTAEATGYAPVGKVAEDEVGY